jgi:hypothetical protein
MAVMRPSMCGSLAPPTMNSPLSASNENSMVGSSADRLRSAASSFSRSRSTFGATVISTKA